MRKTLCISRALAEESGVDATVLASQALIGQSKSTPNQRLRNRLPSTGPLRNMA
jgi:hypothetical protein